VESAIDRIERYMATGGLPPIPKFEEAFANAARREDPELYAKVNDVEMTVA
jgi:hypothetical protein